MKGFFCCFLTLLILASCEDSADKKADVTPEEETAGSNATKIPEKVPMQPQDKPHPGQYCFIKKIYEQDGQVYIDADYIQFLMYEEADEAARKNNDAEMLIDDNGDTTWSTPDPVYIINDNTKIRKLKIAPDVKIFTIEYDGEVFIKKTDLAAFRKIIAETPYALTFNSQNEVIKIQQQYLP